jgi:amino acid permease
VIDRATALAGALYLCVGVLGCLQFGADGAGVRGNVLLNYAADDLSINAGRAGLALTVSIGIALMVHPLRGAVRQLLAVRSAADRGGDGGVRGVREVAEAMVYQATALLAAIFIPEIEVVWSLLGSTVCLLIGYVLPAACYLALSQWAGAGALRHHRKAQALLVGGTALTLLCTATALAQYVL